ncbi:MAG: NAD-dependent DNA ligase LigA [Ignavibacteria bacterium]|nr:NAD-dependent DNA ligase LigA [Ignavibacteria bacterium]
MKIDPIRRIEELRTIIQEHDYNYFVLANPIVSDFTYDQLLKELIELEKKYPEYLTPDSPTQRVGSDISNEFDSVNHKIPMLSLSNTYSEDELIDFDRRVRDFAGEATTPDYICELKIDGVSISLQYENGILKTAATRGDGIIGEDVTNNIKTIRSIPLSVNKKFLKEFGSFNFEVRGEVYMENEDFKKMNDERELNGEKLFANPRNSTAGTIKLLDSKIVAKRPIKAFMYYYYSEYTKIGSQLENLLMLKKLGFRINANYKHCKTINDVIVFCKEWEERRNEIPFEIDGVVIKVNSINLQQNLGSIAKSPRWAVAYKFKAKQASTLLKKITWQVGRTGTLTPVAELEPIFLAGSTISRATLHNFDEIKRKDIREGDSVVIEKGGDVIPKVVSVDVSKRNKNLTETELPIRCPTCGSKLFKPENEVAIYCDNNFCPDQIKGRLIHFASRGAMDIEGLGESLINLFTEMKFLKDFADIYDLKNKRNELIEIERLGEKSVDNLLNAIDKSKNQQFEKVLFSLGIRYVGSGAAKKLAEHFISIDNLISATKEEIEGIYEIGPSISSSIIRFFKSKDNLKLIERLKKAGLNFNTSIAKGVNKFNGKSFVLTGTLSILTRDEAKEKIIYFGGKVSSSVSKLTDYVVVGENPGSKLDKAVKLGLKILTEEEFIEMIK